MFPSRGTYLQCFVDLNRLYTVCSFMETGAGIRNHHQHSSERPSVRHSLHRDFNSCLCRERWPENVWEWKNKWVSLRNLGVLLSISCFHWLRMTNMWLNYSIWRFCLILFSVEIMMRIRANLQPTKFLRRVSLLIPECLVLGVNMHIAPLCPNSSLKVRSGLCFIHLMPKQ